jgi:hypothetical protein
MSNTMSNDINLNRVSATWYAWGRQDAEHNPLVDVFAFADFYVAQRATAGRSIQDAFTVYLASLAPVIADSDDDIIWQEVREFSAASPSGYTVTRLSARLACGHWSSPVHEMSSDWDFPEEEHQCPEGCGLVHYDQRVIAHLGTH